MTYKEQCEDFHKKRVATIRGIWEKVLSDTPYNRRGGKVFTALTDEEIILLSGVIQRYLQKEEY